MKDEFNTRFDLLVFIGAFVSGVVLYVLLHVVLQVHQVIVSAAVIAVMVAYTLLAFKLPLLRVRQDQAGDNAYYLGLLFTLMSMAFALYEFGTAILASGRTPDQGPRQIIANFGIALASTITGIFLRVLLQQMRVDPADLENVTRIELAEASKRVKANVDNVTVELGRFHDEVRQRSNDVVTTLFEETKKSVAQLHAQVDSTTTTMLASVASAHKSVLEQAHEMTRELGSAVARLRTVEPPPVTLSRRLDKVTTVLQTVGDKTEGIATSFQEIARAAESSSSKMAEAANLLGRLVEQMETTHDATTEKIAAAVEKVSTALATVGEQLNKHLGLYAQLEEQSRRSGTEALRAQAAAVEVLTRLAEVAKGLTSVLKEAGRSER